MGLAAHAVGVIAAQLAGPHVLLRACILRIAPRMYRAAGERHGGNAPSVHPYLRLAAGFDALDLVVAVLLIPCGHVEKCRVLACGRQRAAQQADHSQVFAGKRRAAVVLDRHFPGATGLPVDGQRLGTPVGEGTMTSAISRLIIRFFMLSFLSAFSRWSKLSLL